MSKYIVVVELLRIGYIIGEYDDLADAQIQHEKLQILFEYVNESIEYYLRNYKKKYKLNNDLYCFHFILGSSNGELSTRIIELGSHWKSLSHFIADREYNPRLINGAELKN